MAKVSIYLKDALEEAAKDLDIPLSAVCQRAVESAVATELPFLMLTPRARRTLLRAAREAELMGDAFIGTEHLLLALAGDEDGIAGQVIDELGVAAEIFERTRAHVRAASGSNRVVDRTGRLIGYLEATAEGMQVFDQAGHPIQLQHDVK